MSSRRKFLQNTALLTGGSLMSSAFDNKAFAYFKNSISPGEQINIGAIGINGMGWSDVNAALKVPGVNLIGICDVDKNVLDNKMKDLSRMKVDSSKVNTYADYRKMLDNKDIDAVVIGSPDHWHTLQMVHACQAGKDVYLEKPVGNSIGECQVLIKAQQRYKKAVQCGQWQRSQQHFKDAVDFVHSGQLGKIRTVKVWSYVDWKMPLDKKPDGSVPAGVDYKSWLGPAPSRPFNINRFHFSFRWFWDYAGGLMTDWGVHLLDYALLGMKVANPKSISAVGGKFAKPDSADETPDTLTAIYEFDGFNIIWDHALGIGNGSYGKDHGIAFIGNNGTLVVNREGWEVLEEKKVGTKVSVPFKGKSDNGLVKHMENWVTVIKSGNLNELNCGIQSASDIAILSQLGNIAYRSGKKLEWNGTTQTFTDDAINKKYLTKAYHNGYSLPKM